MKHFLFIDRDEDIRHYLNRWEEIVRDNNLDIRIVASVQEAEEILGREIFDGIIIDAITPGANKILPFIKRVRGEKSDLPITALVGFLDMILDEPLKENLKNERVDFVDKVEALHPENFMKLFKINGNEHDGRGL